MWLRWIRHKNQLSITALRPPSIAKSTKSEASNSDHCCCKHQAMGCVCSKIIRTKGGSRETRSPTNPSAEEITRIIAKKESREMDLNLVSDDCHKGRLLVGHATERSDACAAPQVRLRSGGRCTYMLRYTLENTNARIRQELGNKSSPRKY